jgi:hypothetical protein
MFSSFVAMAAEFFEHELGWSIEFISTRDVIHGFADSANHADNNAMFTLFCHRRKYTIS